MAVKRPPNTWVSQILTPKGFRDEVYSEIDGSVVGYIKDGKFIQTIDELPKLEPKKPKQKDPQYVARLKESQALLAIRILEQSAVYYKELAEDIERTPKQRADAKTKLDDINRQIETRSKEAGKAGYAKAEAKTVQESKDAGPRAEEIKSEYKRLQAQLDAVLDPNDPKAARIKAQQENLVAEYKDVYSDVLKIPVSLVAARSNLQGAAPTFGTGATKAESAGPTGAQGPTDTVIPPAPATTPKVVSSGTTGGKTGGATGGKTGGNTGKGGTDSTSGGYTAQEAADLASTVGGTNYFAAKYGSE